MINSHVMPFFEKFFQMAVERELKAYDIHVQQKGNVIFKPEKNVTVGKQTKAIIYVKSQNVFLENQLKRNVYVIFRPNEIIVNLDILSNHPTLPSFVKTYRLKDDQTWENLYQHMADIFFRYLIFGVVPVGQNH